MAQENADTASVTETLRYPPVLNLVVPVVMLVVSVIYAWSLRDIALPEMNLLLITPLLILLWLLLLIVFVMEVLPSLGLQRAWNDRSGRETKPWRQRFAAGTEAGAGLVIAATFLFSFFGPGDGAVVYVASLFIYLLVVGYLMGVRNPVTLLLRATISALGLYLLMGVVLGVRL